MNKKVVLMILDGWGVAPNPKVSAIDQAHTPFIDELYHSYPHATLRTDGLNVGLPEGQMGNSEVGHMNLGAGRIVYQDLVKINRAVAHDELIKEPVLINAFSYAKEQKKAIHFMGLLSDGGVHSHIDHLKGLLNAGKAFGLKKMFLHAFTDGRDVDPKSGLKFLKEIKTTLSQTGGELASVSGRYYAMDRDLRWERVKRAYDAIVKGKGIHSNDALQTVQKSYEQGVTDEFIKPFVMNDKLGNAVATVQSDEVVIFFNFRSDRGRQMTRALSQHDFPSHDMHKLNLHFVTMTCYDETFDSVKVVYPKENIKYTLGEVLALNAKKQIRIAETEKYPHVTFFFSGGREEVFDGEKRILKSSPKVATYDLQPEMSAYAIKDALLEELQKREADFVCLNFANGDMVGHSGVMEAAIKACEAVDACVEAVIKKALEQNYTTLLIADHGNCETMINSDGTPNTAHTTNPVPIILIDKTLKKINQGILADVAPTVLKLMGIKQPRSMTQKPLL